MSRKRICFVVSSPFTAKAFLVNHINRLSKSFDVYLVANFEGSTKNLLEEVNLTGIEDIAIPRQINFFKDFKALLILRSFFKEHKFDVVHTVTPKAGLLGILAARLVKTKFRVHIFTGQVWHTKKGLFKIILQNLDRVIVKFTTHILVDGESQRKFLIENNIISSKNSKVLGKGSISGVNTEKFLFSKLLQEKVRKELKYSDDDVVFMFLGRLNKDKGVLDLIDAFQFVDNKNVKLLLVGEDEENIEMIVKEKYSNTERITFYGKTSEPERILQCCDVFCLPSYREGFGTSVIEASLLEKPVICSDTYGLMDTIIEGETGLRHKVANVQSIYEQMLKLINNENLRMELGKGGREYVMSNFSADDITQKWFEFYKHLLNM